MFLYDYIKENPQQHDKLVKNCWKDIEIQSPMMEAEMLFFQSINHFSDAAMFWHKELVKYHAIYDQTLNDQDIEGMMQSKWTEYLYLYYLNDPAQGTERREQLLNMWMKIAEKGKSNYSKTEYSKEVIKFMIDTFVKEWEDRRYRWGTIEADIQQMYIKYLLPGVYISPVGAMQYLETFTERFIMSNLRDETNRRHVESLLNDCDRSLITGKIDSMNELDRIHDATTEVHIKKMLATASGRKYKYTDEFLDIVKKHRFSLPDSRAALVERGERHSNCVGTYHDRHLMNPHESNRKYSLTRIVFSSNFTMELFIYIAYSIIVGVEINQYKTKYNKSEEPPVNAYGIGIDLTGLPATTIEVWEEKEEQDGQSIAKVG
jgi:hypothetical protein